jgi:hypothetical protein
MAAISMIVEKISRVSAKPRLLEEEAAAPASGAEAARAVRAGFSAAAALAGVEGRRVAMVG